MDIARDHAPGANPLAALLAIVVAVVVGLLLYWLAIEPARDASPVTLIIITIGASILLRGVAQVLFDKQFHKLPSISGDAPVSLLGATVQPQSFWVLGGLTVAAGAVVLVIRLKKKRERQLEDL